MKKKIIIIGKNSFIGANLFKSLKNKFNIKPKIFLPEIISRLTNR